MTVRRRPKATNGHLLKRLLRYPADRAMERVRDPRQAREFWDLLQLVLDRRRA